MLAQAARIFIPNTVHGPVGNVSPDGQLPAAVPVARTAGIPEELGPVLAQIPDLDPKTAPAGNEKLLDGRIISQALSLKMIYGLVIGLVIGAVLPFLFGRGGTPKPVKELPAFNIQAAESAAANQPTIAPKWQPAVQFPAGAPQGATMNMTPPPEGSYRPTALAPPPSWSRPQPSAAAPQPANNLNRDYARGSLPPARADAGAYGYGYAPPADRRDFGAPAERVADRRNDPAAAARNPAANDYGGRSVDPAAVRGATNGPGYGGATYGVPGEERYQATPDAAGRQGNFPPPPPGYGANGDNRYQQNNDAGVAHFDGTITAPPARTNP